MNPWKVLGVQSDHLEGLDVHLRCSVGRASRESEICSGGFFGEHDGVDAADIFACRCVVVRIRRTNREDAGLCTAICADKHVISACSCHHVPSIPKLHCVLTSVVINAMPLQGRRVVQRCIFISTESVNMRIVYCSSFSLVIHIALLGTLIARFTL